MFNRFLVTSLLSISMLSSASAAVLLDQAYDGVSNNYTSKTGYNEQGVVTKFAASTVGNVDRISFTGLFQSYDVELGDTLGFRLSIYGSLIDFGNGTTTFQQDFTATSTTNSQPSSWDGNPSLSIYNFDSALDPAWAFDSLDYWVEVSSSDSTMFWLGSDSGETYWRTGGTSNVNAGSAGIGRALQLFESSASQVPEPSILALMGLGLAGIGFARRRRQA